MFSRDTTGAPVSKCFAAFPVHVTAPVRGYDPSSAGCLRNDLIDGLNYTVYDCPVDMMPRMSVWVYVPPEHPKYALDPDIVDKYFDINDLAINSTVVEQCDVHLGWGSENWKWED